MSNEELVDQIKEGLAEAQRDFTEVQRIDDSLKEIDLPKDAIIQISPDDVTVSCSEYSFTVPRDLKPSEADKIEQVVHALAEESEEAEEAKDD